MLQDGWREGQLGTRDCIVGVSVFSFSFSLGDSWGGGTCMIPVGF